VKKQEIDHILVKMLDSHREVSDLNFTVGKPMQVESTGDLIPVEIRNSVKPLTGFQVEAIALALINQDHRLTETLLRTGSCDLSYALPGKARFRVNIFSQSGNFSIVCRKLESKIPTIEGRNLPKSIYQIAREKNGIVFVTGATGSGKTWMTSMNTVRFISSHSRTRSNISTCTKKPLSTSANSAWISTPSATDCERPCAKPPR
jgi:twitching motility protein PilT